jgi:hypothetical protein
MEKHRFSTRSFARSFKYLMYSKTFERLDEEQKSPTIYTIGNLMN